MFGSVGRGDFRGSEKSPSIARFKSSNNIATYATEPIDTESVRQRFLNRILAITGFAYSVETPGILNTGYEQKFLSEEYMDPNNIEKNVLEWFKPQNTVGEAFFNYIPDNGTDMVNTNLLDVFAVRVNNKRHVCVCWGLCTNIFF